MAPLSSRDLLDPIRVESPTRPDLIVAPDDPAPAVAPPREPAWPAWQRFLFRYVTCHALLWYLPAPFTTFFGTLRLGLVWLGDELGIEWLKSGPAEWAAAALRASEKVRDAWNHVTSFVGDVGWTPFPVVIQQSGSSDTSNAWVRLGCVVLVSLLVATTWSLLSRARGYPRLGRWVHLWARWVLGFTMLSYGFHKVYMGQFGTMDLSRLTQEVGEKSQMGMVWAFMAGSRPYELFGAIGEIAGGLLLFHHRTALLGAVVVTGVMANVWALNWLYDVPVKISSLHLLSIAICLLAPWQHRLVALFVTNRPSVPVDQRVVHTRWLAIVFAAFGTTWIAAHLVSNHVLIRKGAEQRARAQERPELYGLWTTETMRIDGVEVPVTDATRWKFFAIDVNGFAFAREATGRQHNFRYREDIAEGFLAITPFGGAASAGPGGGGEQRLTFERGTKVVKEVTQDPPSMPKYWERIDVERRTLVLKGTFQGKQLELRTIEKVFPFNRPTRYVQEMPFNR